MAAAPTCVSGPQPGGEGEGGRRSGSRHTGVQLAGFPEVWISGGKPSIPADRANWHALDPLMVALPISALVLVVVSLLTKRLPNDHLTYCFGGKKVEK